MKDKRDPGGLLVGGGLLLGMGVGFFINNIPGGMFVGLGAGLIAWAVVALNKKK